MKNNVTMDDIAREVGVSAITVSRAFKRLPYVDEQTRDKIFKIAREKGYIPKLRGMKKDNDRIALIIDSFWSSHEAKIINAIMKELIRRNIIYEVIPGRYMDTVTEDNFRAAMVLSFLDKASEKRYAALSRRMPAVSLKNRKGVKNIICTDFKQSIHDTVLYLHGMGHRRIAMIYNSPETINVHSALAGYRQGVAETGCDIDDDLLQENTSHLQTLFEVIAKTMKQKPTALILPGEEYIAKALYCLDILDVKVPADLSMISFEHPNVSEFMAPPQTTILQDYETIARIAVDSVMAMDGIPSEDNFKYLVPAKLIKRKSVANLTE